MRRHAETFLSEWLGKSGRLPLIIWGARQVGKSTLVRLFSKNHGLNLIEINLEKIKLQTTKQLDFNLKKVLDEIQLKLNQVIGPNSLIFLDEIQEDPRLLSGLHYFFEERPDLPVIAAGSLLEIILKLEELSFPVGRVEFYHLGPMTFTEFIEAQKKEVLLDGLTKMNLSKPLHSEALSCLKDFYYTGGMPRAVASFINEKSLVPVREIQEQIIETYQADFAKYNSRINLDRFQRIFTSAPLYLGQKMIFQKLDASSKRNPLSF